MNILVTLVTALLIHHHSQAVTVPDYADEENSYDYTYNEIDLKPTYRSGVEKVMQGLLEALNKSKAAFAGRLFPPLMPLRILTPWSLKEDRADGQSFGDILNLLEHDFRAIFPGTLWCGAGNISKSLEDVGLFALTDSCCREHDECPYSLGAAQVLGQLKNVGIFSRSACSCDLEFYKCLKSVSTVISANIGTTYFNILRPQCFGYYYPIDTCEKYDSVRFREKKCLKYKLNYSLNKTLEWFDTPDF